MVAKTSSLQGDFTPIQGKRLEKIEVQDPIPGVWAIVTLH